MHRALATLLLAAAALAPSSRAVAQSRLTPAQRARVESLLSRMTLDEKIGQMTQLTIGAVAANPAQANGRVLLDTAKLRYAIVDRHIGSLINVADAALPVEGWHALLTSIEDMATKHTRLGIPLIYGIDFVHGGNYITTGTIFPENAAMAATFDTALARREGEVTGHEALAADLRWNFAPVLDIGRQPLFPRFYETFGEDPLVASLLGAADVRGIQETGRVAATLKHYLAYSGPRTGHDRTPADISEREVREHFLPSFRAGVKAGALAVMVNSGEIDGVPVHASHHWLTDVLRRELGFDGVIVTDWQDIIFLHTRHHVAASLRDAIRMALDAGVDMSMTPLDYDFEDTLAALVHDGSIPVSRIDQSVRRILTLKAELGVLDSPYPEVAANDDGADAPAPRDVALQAAREAITLLKNDGGVLPLRQGARILVTGPAAASITALHGGWSYTWQGADASRYPAGTPTLLDEIRRHSPNVTYVAGAAFTQASDSGIAEAVQAARNADVAVVAIGEDAYAEWIGDIDDLTLPSPQLRLAQAIEATGTLTVLVLVEGRPRVIASIADPAKGIVMAYWPGMAGAQALGEVLFGEVNPSGRLPFTYPRAPNALLTDDHRLAEDLEVGYDRRPGGFDPQFRFGDGLSYTSFRYSDLHVDPTLAPGGRLHVRVTVANTGAREGQDVVLLFTHQEYATITPPVRRLRAFQRVDLAPGASRTLRFTLTGDDLTYVGRDLRPRLDPGAFAVMIGDLRAPFTVTRR